jgi:hypothetical protein
MATRTFVDTKGNTWEWEETKEVVESIENYWKTVKSNEESNN